VILLNVTSSKQALPAFWRVLREWPTPEALSAGMSHQSWSLPTTLSHVLILATPKEVVPQIKTLGLQNKRAQTLIDMSAVYVKDPPIPGVLRESQTHRLLSPISHIPGCGKYAIDSYTIYCDLPGKWKEVRPTDKELTKHLVSLNCIMFIIHFVYS
jgi:methyl-CpG-binding domain protein 4